jgi:serine/threonine protein kinase
MECELTTLRDYRYNPKYIIGEGSFGRVYRGTHLPSGLTVAIKELEVQVAQDMQKEINILKALQHPNIVRYQDAFQVLLLPSRRTTISTSSPNSAQAVTCAASRTARKKSKKTTRRGSGES